MFGIRLRPRIDRHANGSPEYDLQEVRRGIEALEAALEALQGRLATIAAAGSELTQGVQEMSTVLEGHEARFTELIFAVAEGISKVERTEMRIRATVRRARKELEEHGTYSPSLDAEATELRILDGGGGEEDQVQPVRPPVETSTPDLTDVPGEWTQDDLLLLRGA